MIPRLKFRSSVSIPKDLTIMLRRAGGLNPYGEPMYRLILAEDRTVKACGAWVQWAKNATLDERGGLGIKEFMRLCRDGAHQEDINDFMRMKLSAKPQGTITGMVDRPLYAFTGIVLEKWKSPTSYGSPADWYSYRFQGEPALGPYPSHGDYELVAGPTPYMPTVVQLEEAIKQDFRIVEARPYSPKMRLLQHLQQIEAVEAAEKRKTANRMRDQLSEGPYSLRNVVSLGAGRVRQEAANRLGIKEHYGN